jgi:hypothetical protein
MTTTDLLDKVIAAEMAHAATSLEVEEFENVYSYLPKRVRAVA